VLLLLNAVLLLLNLAVLADASAAAAARAPGLSGDPPLSVLCRLEGDVAVVAGGEAKEE
jgi:hypothetical protein